jgi:hypothetical protein
MTYHFNPDIKYCVDINEVKLIDKGKNELFALGYPEAAIFDLLIKQYPPKTMIRMLSKICLITKSHADSLLRDTIEYLVQQNILIQEEKRG